MKQQPYIRTNEEVGLPAFSQLGEGYAVLICHLNNLTKEKMSH